MLLDRAVPDRLHSVRQGLADCAFVRQDLYGMPVVFSTLLGRSRYSVAYKYSVKSGESFTEDKLVCERMFIEIFFSLITVVIETGQMCYSIIKQPSKDISWFPHV